MKPLITLTKIETRVFLREPLAVFWGLVFPSLLLVVLGLVFPGAQQFSEDLGGARLVDLYAPTVIGLSLITLGVSTLPTILATYRERGILRRMSTTPVHPSRLVLGQLVIHAGVAVVASAASIALGRVLFEIALPANLGGFVLAFAVGTAGLFAVGLLIGAVAPTASSGQGIGLAVYFPLLFFAGVYFPMQVMPDGLRTVAELMPSGAVVRSLADTWAGQSLQIPNLVVMAAFAVVFGLAAVRLFRWE